MGEIVRVESNELFPADLLFLTSSEENSICFLETSNLDGETNLKIRQVIHFKTPERYFDLKNKNFCRKKKKKSLKETNHLTTIESLIDFKTAIEYEQPNRNLYEFVGNLKLADDK